LSEVVLTQEGSNIATTSRRLRPRSCHQHRPYIWNRGILAQAICSEKHQRGMVSSVSRGCSSLQAAKSYVIHHGTRRFSVRPVSDFPPPSGRRRKPGERLSRSVKRVRTLPAIKGAVPLGASIRQSGGWNCRRTLHVPPTTAATVTAPVVHIFRRIGSV
jgi:hypothetical protein